MVGRSVLVNNSIIDAAKETAHSAQVRMNDGRRTTRAAPGKNCSIHFSGVWLGLMALLSVTLPTDNLQDKSCLTSLSRALQVASSNVPVFPFLFLRDCALTAGIEPAVQRSAQRKGGGLSHPSPLHTLSPRNLDNQGLPAHTSGHWPRTRLQLSNRLLAPLAPSLPLGQMGNTDNRATSRGFPNMLQITLLATAPPRHDTLPGTPSPAVAQHFSTIKDSLTCTPLGPKSTTLVPCHLAQTGTSRSEPQLGPLQQETPDPCLWSPLPSDLLPDSQAGAPRLPNTKLCFIF